MTERHFTTLDGMKLFDRARPERAAYINLLQTFAGGTEAHDLPAFDHVTDVTRVFRWLE
jgi:hypothetical protein